MKTDDESEPVSRSLTRSLVAKTNAPLESIMMDKPKRKIVKLGEQYQATIPSYSPGNNVSHREERALWSSESSEENDKLHRMMENKAAELNTTLMKVVDEMQKKEAVQPQIELVDGIKVTKEWTIKERSILDKIFDNGGDWYGLAKKTFPNKDTKYIVSYYYSKPRGYNREIIDKDIEERSLQNSEPKSEKQQCVDNTKIVKSERKLRDRNTQCTPLTPQNQKYYWDKREKKAFVEKFSEVGADFSSISGHISTKTEKFVERYYLSNKTEIFEAVEKYKAKNK